MDADREALRAEAADPATPPERLAELVREEDCLPLVMANPNTLWSTLRIYAVGAPHAFLANPVLPLLLVADPNLPRTLPVLAMRRIVQIDDPLAVALARNMYDWQVHDELPHHVLVAGEADIQWETRYTESLRLYDGYDYHNRDYHALGRILARPLALPTWLIAVLATHHERMVREIVATSPAIPADVRAWLFSGDAAHLAGRDNTDPIRFAAEFTGWAVIRITMRPLRRLMNGRDVPAYVLAQAARYAQPWLRRKAASHPCTTPEILRELAADADTIVRQAVAQHPATPPDVLAGLANDATVEMRCILARHPALPGELIAHLAADLAPAVRRTVARRADLPDSLRAALAQDDDANVRAAIQPPPPPAKFASFLAEIQRVQDELADLAPEAILPYCYTVRLGRIVRAIAQDAQTPPHVLAALANHRNTQVRVDVAGNPATPDAVLQHLAQDESRYVALAALARQLALHPENAAIQQQMQYQLFGLARFAGGRVSAMLRQYHVRVPRDMILRGDCNSLAWLAAVASATTAEPLLTFPRMYGWRTRVALARNPATPPEVRAELLRDGNRYVRAAAKASLQDGNRES